MSPPSKTFGLNGPRDLLRKLERDVANLKELQTDDAAEMAFAAFDCAVTAWSLKDWCRHWVNENGRTDLGARPHETSDIQNAAIKNLQVCGQLANGAKHFRLLPNRDDADVSSRVSAAPNHARAGEMRSGDPLVDYTCVAKIETPDGVQRAPFFFAAILHAWRQFMDASRIDVR